MEKIQNGSQQETVNTHADYIRSHPEYAAGNVPVHVTHSISILEGWVETY